MTEGNGHVIDPNGDARRALQEAVAEHGPEVLSNTAVLDSVCRDQLTGLPGESILIGDAARTNVPALLNDLIPRLGNYGAIQSAATTLAGEHNLDMAAALWVVREFARALGYIASVTGTAAAYPGSGPRPVSGYGSGERPAAGDTGTGESGGTAEAGREGVGREGVGREEAGGPGPGGGAAGRAVAGNAAAGGAIAAGAAAGSAAGEAGRGEGTGGERSTSGPGTSGSGTGGTGAGGSGASGSGAGPGGPGGTGERDPGGWEGETGAGVGGETVRGVAAGRGAASGGAASGGAAYGSAAGQAAGEDGGAGGSGPGGGQAAAGYQSGGQAAGGYQDSGPAAAGYEGSGQAGGGYQAGAGYQATGGYQGGGWGGTSSGALPEGEAAFPLPLPAAKLPGRHSQRSKVVNRNTIGIAAAIALVAGYLGVAAVAHLAPFPAKASPPVSQSSQGSSPPVSTSSSPASAPASSPVQTPTSQLDILLTKVPATVKSAGRCLPLGNAFGATAVSQCQELRGLAANTIIYYLFPSRAALTSGLSQFITQAKFHRTGECTTGGDFTDFLIDCQSTYTNKRMGATGSILEYPNKDGNKPIVVSTVNEQNVMAVLVGTSGGDLVAYWKQLGWIAPS